MSTGDDQLLGGEPWRECGSERSGLGAEEKETQVPQAGAQGGDGRSWPRSWRGRRSGGGEDETFKKSAFVECLLGCQALSKSFTMSH